MAGFLPLLGPGSGFVAGLLTGDAPGIFGAFGQPQWGIFAAGSGQPILQADSVFSVEYARDYQISDYQQEAGAFASYNKVQVPFQAKVSFLANALRYNFLSTAEPACASLGLVTIVMPEFAYPSANLTHYGFRRTARNGKTLILFDVWCEEVRILPAATSQPTAANNPSVASSGAGTAADAATSAGSEASNGVTSQSTNGATATQSGQVQPGATQPTSSGGPVVTNNFEEIPAESTTTGDSAFISYSWTPGGGNASYVLAPDGGPQIIPAPPGGSTGVPQTLGSQSSISTGSTVGINNFESPSP